SEWFRLVSRSEPCCISGMFCSDETASFCDGFQKFEMRSSVSTVFLKIKQVDLSDSGLYFCGFYIDGHTVIANDCSGECDDEVDKCTKDPDGITSLACAFLGGVTVFLIMVIIGLVLKIRQLEIAAEEEMQAQTSENLDSDELKYAALSFHPKPKRSRRPASEKEVEPNVVYAATR
ncbi:uncharacterized protein LOC144537882, partial [Centroberyx gerrardi]